MNVDMVSTDTAGTLDALTILEAFFRLAGNSVHPSNYPRIDLWAKRLRKWIDGAGRS